MNKSLGSIQHFINNKNLSMLWEVLLDELQLNSLNSSPIIQNIKTVFDGNIDLFKTRANPNMGLMSLNKQFLNQVLIAVNQLFPNLKQEQMLKRINIGDEVIDEPYRVEDIHNARQSNFEKQVLNKRNEFENSINIKKPKPIDFADKVEPELKITEMEALIAETMAKRKFDIDQLQEQNITTKSIVKTIPKTEKSVSFNDNITHIESYQDNNNSNNSNSNNNDNNITIVVEENIINTNNIFSKLKKNKPDTVIEQKIIEKSETSQDIKILEEKINNLSIKLDKLITIVEYINSKINN
jgi:hypothetical protein